MKKLLLCTVIVLAMSFKANAQGEAMLVPFLTDLVGTANAQLGKDISSVATATEALEGNKKYWDMAKKADQALTDLKALDGDIRLVRMLETSVNTQRRAVRAWERTKRSYKDIGLQSHEVRAIRYSLLSCIEVIGNLKNITELIFSKDLRTDQGQRMELVNQTMEDIEQTNRTLLKLELYIDEKERQAKRIQRFADSIEIIETY